jgi:ABC-2 type transport system permease protein
VSAVLLAARQMRFTNRAFWRNPASAFFTFVFPLMFLVIFTGLFGNDTVPVFGSSLEVRTSTYYVPAIAAFSIITACYTNIAITTTFLRDQGVLKRIRGTPLPAWSYLSARILHAVLIGIVLVVIVTSFGVAFYNSHLSARTMPAFVVTIIVGAAAFCALGLAITAMIPNPDAAPPVVNITVLPILFISDIFIPIRDPHAWYVTVAKVFPVWHFAQAMKAAYFSPTGAGFRVGDLLVVALWGLGGLILAARFFSWEPRR